MRARPRHADGEEAAAARPLPTARDARLPPADGPGRGEYTALPSTYVGSFFSLARSTVRRSPFSSSCFFFFFSVIRLVIAPKKKKNHARRVGPSRDARFSIREVSKPSRAICAPRLVKRARAVVRRRSTLAPPLENESARTLGVCAPAIKTGREDRRLSPLLCLSFCVLFFLSRRRRRSLSLSLSCR